MKRFIPHFSWLQWIIHISGWIPLAVLLIDYYSDNLTANPIQAATQRTGQAAIIFLLLSLACTPLVRLAGFRQAAKLRRPLGLFAFMYAGIHFLMFAWADFGWRLDLISREFIEKRYLWVGLPALIILLALAVTSTRKAMQNLGKRWKHLHRLVYLAAGLVVLHMAWVSKGDLFSLSGDIIKPLLAAIALIVLLALRLPFIKSAIAGKKNLFRSKKPSPKTTLFQGKEENARN